MTLYALLLFLHIVAAITWVGAATTYFMLELRTDLTGDIQREAEHNDDAEWLAPRLFIPASIGTLVFGALAAIEGNWDFGSLWIVIGLAGFGISFVIGVGYFEPEAKKLAAATERHGAAHPDVRSRIASLKLVGRIELAILYVVVAAMVIKPTGEDSGTIFALALIVAAATAGALAWRKRLSTRLPQS
jgi:uncharacterized membrane protein